MSVDTSFSVMWLLIDSFESVEWILIFRTWCCLCGRWDGRRSSWNKELILPVVGKIKLFEFGLLMVGVFLNSNMRKDSVNGHPMDK
jgi:hypothetical protein